MSQAPGRVAAAALLAVTVACAEVPPPTLAPASPRYPEYVYPDAGERAVDRALLERHERAWHALQAGDLRLAEREFHEVLRRAPGFDPAETGLGYVHVARESYAEALARFDAVVARTPGYAPALAGRGEALLAEDRVEAALEAFEGALASDSSLVGVARRIDVLRFRALEALVGGGRAATDEGRLDEAAALYRRAIDMSPGSAFLHRELAEVERARGRLDAALGRATRAVELDDGDARALVTLAEVHLARGAYDEAVDALTRAAGIDPSPSIQQRLEEVRALSAMARMPPEYRGLARAPVLTRGGLAALVGVRLEPLVRQAPPRTGVLITDIQGHWAAGWILAVARAGVMEVYPNYTFQPSATVDRGGLAVVVSRLLDLVARDRPDLAAAWMRSAHRFTDLMAGHLSYPAASKAVASGVMVALEQQTFQLTRPVSGAEAVAAIDRLQVLAGMPVR